MAKQRERKLIQDYILARYPGRRVIFGCPLGPVPERLIATWGPQKALRVGRGLRPEVDALVFEDSTLILVEAKIVKWMDGVSKLPVYKGLVPTTPELQQYRDWPVYMVLCIPWLTESIMASARSVGVSVDEFTTPDLELYVQELHKYWTSEYRIAREEKRRARELLGLE